MSGQIAEAFVRIRPNTAGFRAETETSVKSAMLGVGKIVGGVFAATGVVAGIKDIASAAAQHQAAFAVLDKTITDAGASTQVFGKNIEAVLEKESRLTGFKPDEDLASAFTRLVSVSHDSVKALHELRDAEDVARARHIDVATAALALSRAEQGSTISLSRLGIIIPKVSAAQSALRHEHDLATAAGVKFTAANLLQYKADLAAAKSTDAQATAVKALEVVHSRFGGTATAFANSAQGSFDKLSGTIHQFEVQLGSALLPPLSHGAAALEAFLTKVDENGSAARAAKEVMHELGDAFGVVGTVVHLIAPPLGLIAHALLEITRVAGGGNILAIAVAMKAYAVGATLAAVAQKRLDTVTAIYRGEQASVVTAKEADTAATTMNAGALTENTAALLANAEAASLAATSQLRLGGASAVATGGLRTETTIAKTGVVATEAQTGVRALGSSVLGLASSMNLYVTAGLGAILVTEHFIGKLKAVEKTADEAIAHLGTKRGAALSFYSHRVEALVNEGMSRIHARALAEEQTFAHLGVHIHKVLTAAASAKTNAELIASGAVGKLPTQVLEHLLKTTDAGITQTEATIKQAGQKLADAELTLANAIRDGNQSIHDSIVGADSNLQSIGASISDMLGQFLDAQQKSGAAMDISAKEYTRLRAQIIAGKGGVGTQTAAETLASKVEQGQTAASANIEAQKTKAKQGIADLVDEFNKGQITLRQLNQGIAKILASDGFTYKRAGKLLGVAFVDGFKAELAGITQQASEILKVPARLRAGITGFEPNIVRPADTIRQVAQEIHADRVKVAAAAHADAKLEHKLAGEQVQQQKITNELLRRRRAEANANRAVAGVMAPEKLVHDLVQKLKTEAHGREIVTQLHTSERSRSRDATTAIREAQRQTHILGEMLTDERKKRPKRPKPSHAPGQRARRARSAARHNLVP